MSLEGLRLAPQPGAGLVARFPEAVVWAGGERAAEVIEAVRRGEAPPAGSTHCVLSGLEPGAQLLVGGGARVVIRSGGSDQEAGGGQALAEAASLIWAGGGDPQLSADPVIDLAAGVVAGGGFVLALAGAISAPPPAGVRIVNLATAAAPVRPPLAGGSAAEAAPAPAAAEKVIVDGVLCTRGHFNSPEAAYCSMCGISMQQQTHYVVQRPRPPLGILVLDDGTVFPVDGDYVLGGAPEADPAVLERGAVPLTLEAASGELADVQAELCLSGWTVELKGRSAGTRVQAPGAGWTDLKPGGAATLTTATKVELGGRTLTYHGHHDRRPDGHR